MHTDTPHLGRRCPKPEAGPDRRLGTVGAVPTDSAPILRRATPDDAEALADLRVAVAGEGRWIGLEAPVDRDAQVTLMRNAVAAEHGAMFVADLDGEVIALAGIHDAGAGLGELFMANAPGHRGHGVGTALLAELLTWARADPATAKVVLQVWPHNEAALALYRRAGFVVEGYRHRHWPRRDGSRWDVIEMGLLVED